MGKVIGRKAAIKAAKFHRDRATSDVLREYWQRVIDRIKEKEG